MKCPKCNTDNPPSAAVCSSCGSPLSDAPYTTIDNGTDGKARRKKWPLILILVLLLLTCGGFLGYNYYINRVEKECITFTNELFRGLKELDLSNIEEKYSISASYFCKLFKSASGLSFVNYFLTICLTFIA